MDLNQVQTIDNTYHTGQNYILFRIFFNQLKCYNQFTMKQETFEWVKGIQQYSISLSPKEDGFQIKVEDIKTRQIWINAFTEAFLAEISQKAGKKVLASEIMEFLITSLRSKNGIDMMSAFQLESLKIKRGGQSSTQNKKSNKKYLILTIGSGDQKVHYPLPLPFKDAVSIQQLKQMIKALKNELQNSKEEQKSNSSISDILNTSNVGDNLKVQNQKMKQMIKEIEQQLAQKKGAVELDQIIRQKNDLELKADAAKRQQNKQLAKLKTIYLLREKEVNDMKNEINLIRKELDIGEEGNTKLKSHMMRVLKINETELNNAKKVIMKQQKQIANHNKNLQNAKQNQKKLLMKIKQIQTQIDQAKKKLNTKEISNRLYSPSGSKKSTSSVPARPMPNRVAVGNLVKRATSHGSVDSSSNASSTSKPRSYNGPVKSNLIRPSYNQPVRRISDPLTRTTPALKVSNSRKDPILSGTTRFSPNRTSKPPIPTIPSNTSNLRSQSPKDRTASINRLSQPKNVQVKPPQPKIGATNSYKVQPLKKPIAVQLKGPIKRQLTQKQKNIFNKIDEIKSKLEVTKK